MMFLGIIRFHETSLSETNGSDERDLTDPVPSGSGLLERLVGAVRDSLGAELGTSGVSNSNQPIDDPWMGPDDASGDRAGFLRMVRVFNRYVCIFWLIGVFFSFLG